MCDAEHAWVVDAIAIGRAFGIEKFTILGVGDLVFADLVGVSHRAVAGRISSISRISDVHPVHGNSC